MQILYTFVICEGVITILKHACILVNLKLEKNKNNIK